MVAHEWGGVLDLNCCPYFSAFLNIVVSKAGRTGGLDLKSLNLYRLLVWDLDPHLKLRKDVESYEQGLTSHNLSLWMLRNRRRDLSPEHLTLELTLTPNLSLTPTYP